MQFINNWTQGIIISVIIATIIEMILPNNGNGKYVKVVIGIFVLFTIISPVIGKLKNGNTDSVNLESYIDNQSSKSVETSSISMNNQDTIKNIYQENLKIDIKSKIAQKGYVIDEINLEILDNSEYSLNKIDFKVISKNSNSNYSENNGNQVQNSSNNTTTIVENIENIKISLGGSSKDNEKKEEASIISESEKRKLKQYLSSVYEVNENNISIR